MSGATVVGDATFEALCAHFRARPDRRGEVHVDCPNCFKEAKRGETHFSFSEHGGYCFCCGYGAGLAGLAQKILGEARAPAPAPIQRPRVVKAAPPWQEHGVELVTAAMRHPERDVAWAAYKPILPATLDRYRFGFGRLPFQGQDGSWYWSTTYWLTCPVFEDGALVGLRGRNTGTDGPKWISATGSRNALWGLDDVHRGDVVLVAENLADAAWCNERYPDYRAVALGGAATWQPEWTARLAQKRPGAVIVITDNDLAGQPGPQTYARLVREWRLAHPDAKRVPEPNGPKIANELLQAGLTVRLFRWPSEAPDKADLGWLLAQERQL